MLSKSQVTHVLIPGAQGLLQEGSEGLCCGVWSVPSRREVPAHMGADLRGGGGLAAGGDINTGFCRRASMSPGRGVWKGTEGQGLSTFQGTTVNTPGCCDGTIYTRAPAVAHGLGRRVQPHPRSPPLRMGKSSWAGHSHTGWREQSSDTPESIPCSLKG